MPKFLKKIMIKKYMHRCLELARMGLGNTYPNPLVGSVIVYKNQIIGEGYHTQAGKPHAEVNAINSVKDKSVLKESTLYVNLEPCSHHGRTPPCANLIVEHKIPKVVIGTIDTTAKVSGKGINILKQNGCEVIVNVLEKESREINKRFFTFHEKKRPYIILKWAQTIDGYIDIIRDASSPTQPTWISDEIARIHNHKWRAQEQSIIIGTNTVVNDNPKLNVRDWTGVHPLRLVIDKKLRIKEREIISGNLPRTVCFNEIENKYVNENLSFVKISFKKPIIVQILHFLFTNNIQSVIVEGGTTLLNSFIKEDLWDEARIFVANKSFKAGIKAPELNCKASTIEEIGNSRLIKKIRSDE